MTTGIDNDRLQPFKAKLKEYCRRAEVTQQQLASLLGICCEYFTGKLNGYRKVAFFTPKQVAQIIDYLAKHEAFYTEGEKMELLEIAYSVESTKAAGEWFSRLIRAADTPQVRQPVSKVSLKVVASTAKQIERPKTSGIKPVDNRGRKARNLKAIFPTANTFFVGREKELNEIANLLATSADMPEHSRLVTLSGLGGVGKTRLALEVVNELTRERVFKDGTRFVDLSQISRGENTLLQLLSQLFKVLELPLTEASQAGDSAALTAHLVSHLYNKSMLIVLDNFEQLLNDATAGLITDLLAVCSKLRIIVTSREILKASGERVIRLKGLTSPEANEYELTRVASYPAVTLLVNKLTEIQAGFRLSEENVSVVAELCRLLDGLPLALELAARHVRYFSLETLRDLLLYGMAQTTHKFNLLASTLGSLRSLPPRHKSLNAVIDSSYTLLTEPEKKLFCYLARFKDGFTLETIMAVYADFWTGEETTTGEPEGENGTIELLSSLIDKSLVQAESLVNILEDGTRQVCTRYSLLGIVSRYAHNRLVEILGSVQVCSAPRPVLIELEQVRTTKSREKESLKAAHAQAGYQLKVSSSDRKNWKLEPLAFRPTQLVNTEVKSSRVLTGGLAGNGFTACALAPPAHAS